MSRSVRCVIVDDEPLARRRLRRLLGRIDDVEITGEYRSGEEVLRALEAGPPDVVLLDVQMPGLLGIDVAERVGRDTAVVFTTAHSEHAVRAFEQEALDYLLKPIEFERLCAAMDRVRERRRSASPRPTPPPGGAERIFVTQMGAVIPVPTREIMRLEASGDYVTVHTTSTRYYLNCTLASLEERLDPDSFLRVHRSHVVNLAHVQKFVRRDASRLAALMSDGSHVEASRRRSREIRSFGSDG